jgi:polysaccharide biosynthesis protein PslA
MKYQYSPMSPLSSIIKRSEDLILGVAILVLLIPALLLIAALIHSEGRGPVLFRQRRLGYRGKIFEILKFRTTTANVHDEAAPGRSKYPRATRLGTFLRRTSLDDLPQLINVIKGDMSLVGPRPYSHRTTVEGLRPEEAVPTYMSRYRVRPGITGSAQINGCRNPQMSVALLRICMEADTYYIDNWSIFLDIKILLKTVATVVRASNPL